MSWLASRTLIWVLALGFAAFLALYWILRGAPIGQATAAEEEDSPRAGYRDRVIAAMVIGLLLIATGGVVALTAGIPWSFPPFAAGFGIVLTLISANRRHRHASPTLRRSVEFSHWALTAALIAGLLIVVNVLAFRYGGRPLDFTREGAYSLSTLTRKQLATLSRPVTLTLFAGESERAAAQSDRVQQLLELYRRANPGMVRLERVNPFREYERFETIAKRVPDVAVTQGGGVLIEYGEGDSPPHAVVRNNDLFDLQRGGDFERFRSAFHGEDAVTSALIGLREEKKPRIAFTTGHGEISISSNAPRRPSLGFWKARLGATGCDVIEVNLIDAAIPDDAAVVIVAAPRTPLKPDEVAKLRAYSDRGGSLLILAGNQDKAGLEDFLRSFNVTFGEGVVVDRRLNYRGQPSLVYVPITGQVRHPIVDPLVDRFVLMPAASPIHPLGIAGTPPSNPAMVATPLLRTSKDSWAETDLTNPRAEPDNDKDERGPLTLGVAVSERPRPGSAAEGRPRLVFLSGAGIAHNVIHEIEPTNQDLLMNAVGWLRGRSDLQGIPAKTHDALTLAADPVLRARLILVPTVMAFLLIVGLGLTTYVSRRD